MCLVRSVASSRRRDAWVPLVPPWTASRVLAMDVADRIAKLERALQVVATDPARARVDLEMERARKKAAGEEEEEEDAAATRPFSRSRRRPPLRRPWLPRRIRRCAGRPRTRVLPVPAALQQSVPRVLRIMKVTKSSSQTIIALQIHRIVFHCLFVYAS